MFVVLLLMTLHFHSAEYSTQYNLFPSDEGPQVFHKSTSHLQIVGVGGVALSTLHSGGPQNRNNLE